MRNDHILTTTQGVRAGKHHSNTQGMTRIAVMKGFNEPTDSIEVEVLSGTTANVQRRESALITITFSDGISWSGHFPDLKEKLSPDQKTFPNGFEAWQETHFEVVSYLQETVAKVGSFAEDIAANHGTGGLYMAAASLTDKFEMLHKGREWDGDFFDEFDAWIRAKETQKEFSEGISSRIPDDRFSKTWSIEDVHEVANKSKTPITDDQAKDIIRILRDDHDPAVGINWDVISTVITMYLEGKVN